jgi:hypothetical protein
LEGLLTDKLDLHFDMVKTHQFADMGNLTRPLTDNERKTLQNYINQGYQLFVKRCAEGRGVSMEAIEKVAEGRVWTGADAKELGLVDELGGLDIKLEKKTTLSGTTYEAGVNTLHGKAAVAYAVEYNYSGKIASDRERMLRQRQVFAALLQRLGANKWDSLYYVDKNTGSTKGAIGRLMLGANPIRSNFTSFGKMRLLNIGQGAAERMKLSEAVARFANEIGKIPLSQITCSILPGESALSGSATVYSVNRAQTIELLNTQMNPYGLTLSDSTVGVPQLVVKQKEVDTATATLDTVAQEQTGSVTTTTKATATTTTLAGMG